MSEFTNNHYVPEWYQRRFMLPGQGKYHYLDLHPETRESNGRKWTRRALRRLGPRNCFAQDDLYTIRWGNLTSVDIERFFFGRIDGNGNKAVEAFADFDYSRVYQEATQNLLEYMSVQKLRTPKGLGWLSQTAQTNDRNLDLLFLQRIRHIFGATWADCVWQIVDASASPTKFIVSDHPVTVYNRGCLPLSKWCKGLNDPDIRLAATHTVFPLSLDKALILTNLSWARNPYQRETRMHPNPRLFRPTMFKITDIQTGRQLSEQEVLAINFIIKKRAHRYVAAAEEEWLHPEPRMETDHWRKLGDGWLLMPEPRELHMGGEIIVGFDDRPSEVFGPYGHRPWQKGYKDEMREERESASLERFKAEFARIHGPKFRGTSMGFGGRSLDGNMEMHARYLERTRAHRRRSR